MTPTEIEICASPELVAWDRAVGKLYRLVGKASLSVDDQRVWLASRNACGSARACILNAYRTWPGFDSTASGFGALFDRRGTGPSDPSRLEVLPIYGNWYYFSVDALHIMNARTGAVNMGEVAGLIELQNDSSLFDDSPGEQYGCRLKFERKSAAYWSILERDEDAICGGVNVFLSGGYFARDKKPR